MPLGDGTRRLGNGLCGWLPVYRCADSIILLPRHEHIQQQQLSTLLLLNSELYVSVNAVEVLVEGDYQVSGERGAGVIYVSSPEPWWGVKRRQRSLLTVLHYQVRYYLNREKGTLPGLYTTLYVQCTQYGFFMGKSYHHICLFFYSKLYSKKTSVAQV